MNDAMADANYGRKAQMLFDPAQQELTCGAVIRSGDGKLVRLFALAFGREAWIGQTDAFHFAGEPRPNLGIRPVPRELDARGPAVNCEHAPIGCARCIGPAWHSGTLFRLAGFRQAQLVVLSLSGKQGIGPD